MKTIYTILICIMSISLCHSDAFLCPDPPINDDPCTESDNPPYDLTGGGSHVGTTCCARGPQDENPDGSPADFGNVDCSAATQDAAVWYMYTPNPDDDGYDVILEQGGMDPSEGPIGIEVYKGLADQGCNGGFAETIASSCADFGVSLAIGNSFAEGEVLFVKVSTDDSSENCGTFILSILPASCGTMYDECAELDDTTPIEPITNPDFWVDYICITGCLDYGTPEVDAHGGCSEFTEMPTVWYKIVVDDLANQMYSTIEPMGNWEPVWSIYSGPDCDNLSIVDYGGTSSCSDGDPTPEFHQTSVFGEEENYWVAISIDPFSLPPGGLDDGTFEICVATVNMSIYCIGEEESDFEESLVMEVTEREMEGEPLDGPFCQGEEVTINVSFYYDATESGADWLAGFVPVFGRGWDLENFDYTGNAPIANGQTAQWYEDDGDCAPVLQEDVPILCTYTDYNGDLQICNALSQACPDCPQIGMEEGDVLPSGYFWVSNGGNPGCDNDCSPGEGWGIGSTTAQVDWTFTLTTKVFDDFDDCLDFKDLTIGFQTFSHGTIGCWEDPESECYLDRYMTSPAWEIECEASVSVQGPDQEICHDGIVNIPVFTVDGSTVTIIVEVEDNPFVLGESSHVFLGGTGTIDDDLYNTSNEVQIVTYNVYSEDVGLPCPGVTNQIEVTVHPEIQVSFPPIYVCAGECVDISPDVTGGIGGPYTYDWSTGDTSPHATVCPSESTAYFVRVFDEMGCDGAAEVVVEVVDNLEVMLPDSIVVVKDDDFDPSDPDYGFCLEFVGGTTPYSVEWNAPPGLVGTTTTVEGECYAINEVTSSEWAGDNGEYILEATATDFYGCTASTTMKVIVQGDGSPIDTFKIIYDYFIDENENGVRDTAELSFGEGAMYLEPDQELYFNTMVGADTLTLLDGTYTLTYISATTENWKLTTDSIVTVVLDSMNQCPTVEFGLKKINLVTDMALSHLLIRRCNTDQRFHVIADNTGTSVSSGVLWLELDEDLVPEDVESSTEIDTFISPNRVGWFFEDLAPGNKIIKVLDVHVPGPPDLPVGWVLRNKIYAEIYDGNGGSANYGEKELAGNIQCGYDPNDKAVEPYHEEGYTHLEEEELTFKVRFQNTGNAPAIDIEIRDTLSEHVDPASVDYVRGSHDEHLTMTRLEDRILVFTFDNIFLPDSTSDLEGSQGFLIYRVRIKEGVPEGTLIENTAHIYFDNNPAVVTNTTKNILYDDMDEDGFFSIEDCDDEDPAINADAEEIPNNEIDEDCDGEALIIDNDMDGFNSDEDCDDEDPEINPDAEEIINNDVDENCDNLVVIIDMDEDGFHSDEDCDDEDPAINPDAEEIPDNDVDENCDGIIEITQSTSEVSEKYIVISPNPFDDEFHVGLSDLGPIAYVVHDIRGNLVLRGSLSKSSNTISLEGRPSGLYLISFTTDDGAWMAVRKLSKI